MSCKPSFFSKNAALERLVDLVPSRGFFEVGDAFWNDPSTGKMQRGEPHQHPEMNQPLVANGRPFKSESQQAHQVFEMREPIAANLVFVQFQSLKVGNTL
ncbi:MAG: hypothetical protein ACR2OA_17450 [Rubripirellula sp.]|jgi:hypothetical protein